MKHSWEHLKPLLSELLSLPPAERRTWLDARADEDPEIAVELAELIAAESDADTAWLQPPVAEAPATHIESADHLGPYRLIKELGRGGQGQVHLAEDTRLGRKVALKVLSGFGAASSEVLQRFRREAEVASKLDHPGICTVYDTGEANGVPYIAMRYVEGQSLAQWLSASKTAGESCMSLTFMDLESADQITSPEAGSAEPSTSRQSKDAIATIVHLMEKVARALQVAHDAGVIHRDIKPGNIMITTAGEPVILDFGLARALEDDLPTLTRSGDVFGTPAYMAPEQLIGRQQEIDAWTDVWALGVTLHECLALRRPFEAPTRDGLYRAILNKEPPPVDQLNPSIPKDLAVVVETALRKEPDRRYQTAGDLADELERVRNFEPIQARPISTFERTVRWARRNPVVTVSLLVLLAGLVVSVLSLDEARKQKHVAETASEERGRALDRTRSRYLASEAARLRDRDPELAVALTIEAMRCADDEVARSSAWDMLRAFERRPIIASDASDATWLLLSADGSTLAAGSATGIRLHDTAARAVLHHYEQPLGSSTRAAFSPDGAWLAYVEQDRGPGTGSVEGCRIHLLSIREPRTTRVLEGHKLNVVALAFSPDGGRLASGEWLPRSGPTQDREHAIRVWDTRTGKCEFTFERHRGPILELVFAGDEELISCSLDETLRRWDLGMTPKTANREKSDELVQLVSLRQNYWYMGFAGTVGNEGLLHITRDREQVLAASGRRWQATEDKPRPSTASTAPGLSLIPSPDGHVVLFAPVSASHLGSRQRLSRLEGVVFDPKQDLVNGFIRLGLPPKSMTITDPGPQRRRGDRPSSPIPPGQRWVVSLDEGGNVSTFDSKTGTLLRRWSGQAPARPPLWGPTALSPNGLVAALVDAEGNLRSWSIGQHPVLPALPKGGSGNVSANGEVCVRWAWSGKVLYRADPRTGQEHALTTFADQIRGAQVTRSGKYVAVRTQKQALVVEAVSGRVAWRRDLDPTRNWTNTQAVADPTGRRLAVQTETSVIVFAESEQDPLCRVEMPLLETMEFSPDGQRLVVYGAGKIRVHDIASDSSVFSRENERITVSPDAAFGLTNRLSHSIAQSDPIRARVVDLKSGKQICEIRDELDQGPPNTTALGSRTVAIPTRDGDVVLFDSRTGARRQLLQGTRSQIVSLRFSQDEAFLTGLTGKEVIVWNLATGSVHGRLARPSSSFDQVRFLGNELLVIVGSVGSGSGLLVLPLDPLPYLNDLGVRGLREPERRHFGLTVRQSTRVSPERRKKDDR